MKRRSFLIRLGGAVVATPVALKLAGCSGSDDPDPPVQDANNPTPDGPEADAGADAGADASMADCTANGARVSNISANHGHFLDIGTIPADDVNNPAVRTYNIQGASLHPHTITLQVVHFEMLASGQTVVVTSSVDAGHPHTVTIVCA